MTNSIQQVSVIKILVDGGISTEMIVSIVYTMTLKSFVQFHNAQNVHNYYSPGNIKRMMVFAKNACQRDAFRAQLELSEPTHKTMYACQATKIHPPALLLCQWATPSTTIRPYVDCVLLENLGFGCTVVLRATIVVLEEQSCIT